MSEPHWRSALKLQKPLCPQQQNWLLDKGSLTTRLLCKSHGKLSVTILRQELRYPLRSEYRLLSIPRKKLALVREVILGGGDQPWVFARSIIPLSTLTGRLRKLRTLDNQPLGALLFSDHSMRRGEFEVAQITRQQEYVPSQFISDKPLWGRRSTFYVDNKPLLVSEVFLDTFHF